MSSQEYKSFEIYAVTINDWILKFNKQSFLWLILTLQSMEVNEYSKPGHLMMLLPCFCLGRNFYTIDTDNILGPCSLDFL